MSLIWLQLLLLSCVATAIHLPRDQVKGSKHSPVAYGTSESKPITNLSSYDDNVTITLHDGSSLATLDYGTEVEGWPYIDVLSTDGPASIELKFTEPLAGLDNPNGDGPWTFSNGLSNSWRTERFNITKPGRYISSLLQGGLRWQTIKLLSGGLVEIYELGLQPSTSIREPEWLPGSLQSSKQVYNDVWNLGARTVQAACYDAYSQPSTWGVTNQGVFLQGQQPAQSLKGINFSNYTLMFETLVVNGGVGWKVAASARGYGAYFVLTSNDYPSRSISSTSFAANTLIAGYGYNIINQTTLTSATVKTIPLGKSFDVGRWYSITTNISEAGYEIAIDDVFIATVSYEQAKAYTKPTFDPHDVGSGTWGFGPFQDQNAYVRNVEVVATNGTALYSNSMTSTDVLDEYGVNTNSHSVCVDGAKRDRLVWLGDFAHTARTILSTTNRSDFITGSLDFAFELQLDSGPGADLIPVSAPMGASPVYKAALYPSSFGLTDYNIFALKTVGDYYRLTGDLGALRNLWPQIKRLASVLIGKIDPSTGLVAGLPSDLYFISGIQQNATAVTGLLSLALQGLSPLADSLDDSSSASLYTSTASNLTAAINTHLWSDTLGSYSISLQDRGNQSLSGTAFAILSGAANTTQATLAVTRLSELFTKISYRDSSAVMVTNTTQLSPNVQGFLLEALFYAYKNLNVSADVVVPVITNLLDVFWPHMLQYPPGQDQYYTGTTWEYLYPDGSPGIGLFTSHAHPWSSAPTYVMSEYVLGVRPVDAGFKTWTFDPVLGKELGLTFVKGKVPTPYGIIDAEWTTQEDGSVKLSVNVPAGTSRLSRDHSIWESM